MIECPECGGALRQIEVSRVLTRERDHVVSVKPYVALANECYDCGHQFVTPDQMSINDAERAAAWDALMFLSSGER